MHELYELKEILLKELEEYGRKGSLSAGELEIVDKLAHATKNVCKVIESADDEGYSNRGSYYDGNNRLSYRGRSYRRDGMGRYAREGGYSYTDSLDGIVEEMRGMMDQLPEDKRREVQRFVDKMSH